jgi:hypothetical protein
MGRWEWYMVRNELWASAGLNDGFLCIACLESRIGRKLTSLISRTFRSTIQIILGIRAGSVRGSFVMRKPL